MTVRRVRKSKKQTQRRRKSVGEFSRTRNVIFRETLEELNRVPASRRAAYAARKIARLSDTLARRARAD